MKNYFTLLLTLFITTIAFGQTVHTITINFKEKSISPLPNRDSIKIGDYYQIYVKDINMNLWNINYSSKDSTLTTPLKTPTFEEISFTNLNSLVSSFNYFVDTQTVDVKELSSIEKRFVKRKGGQTTKNSCEEFAGILSYFPNKGLGFFKPSIENAKKKYDKLRLNIHLYELNLLGENPVEQKGYHYENALREVELIKETLLGTEEKVNEIRKSYDSVVNIPANKVCLDKNKDLQTLHKKNLEIYNSFSAKIVEIRDQLKADKIMALVKNVRFLKNGVNDYKSLPIQFNGEKTKVSLKFSPQKPEYNEQTYNMNFEFPKTNTNNYWSLGASFFASTLTDERFSIISQMPNDSTTTYSVIEEKEDKLELGVATMLRFGKKFEGKENLGYHGSFGAGVNIGKNVRPRLLFGAGISCGKKHSITFDAGLIAGYVDEKSNAISLQEVYAVNPT